ncbi:MAG: glycosyltransferase family 4 protein [Candidatus Moranbacteria bacterium]|nr:glycosyltransferase family 4 protein [Candidatus Moranbacteria bacterium]
MKILFLNYEYPPLGGGAANATAYLLDEFSRMSGVEVNLITSSIDSQYHRECIGEHIVIHRLPIGKNAKSLHFQSVKDLFVYTWKSYRFAKALLKKEKIDVAQAFFTVPCGLVAWKLHREFRVPYVVSLRGSDVPGYSDRFDFLYPFIRPIARAIWRGAAAVVSNSQGLKDLAHKTSLQQEIGIIHNGVDTEHFFPKQKASLEDLNTLHLTLGASRLTDRKGIRYLIEAIHLLKEEYTFMLKVIGEGNAKARLEQLVSEYGLESQVTFVGRIPREETLRYYQEADMFVLPSLNEGMSNAMLEALSCGLPIITTRTGGAEELVQEGENGLLIRKRDAKDVARALRMLAQDVALRERMGEKSRALAESMSWKNIAQQYAEVYKKTTA